MWCLWIYNWRSDLCEHRTQCCCLQYVRPKRWWTLYSSSTCPFLSSSYSLYRTIYISLTLSLSLVYCIFSPATSRLKGQIHLITWSPLNLPETTSRSKGLCRADCCICILPNTHSLCKRTNTHIQSGHFYCVSVCASRWEMNGTLRETTSLNRHKLRHENKDEWAKSHGSHTWIVKKSLIFIATVLSPVGHYRWFVVIGFTFPLCSVGGKRRVFLIIAKSEEAPCLNQSKMSALNMLTKGNRRSTKVKQPISYQTEPQSSGAGTEHHCSVVELGWLPRGPLSLWQDHKTCPPYSLP